MVIACSRRGGPITPDVFEKASAITLICMANVNAVAWTLRHIGIRTSWSSAFKNNQRCRPRAHAFVNYKPLVCATYTLLRCCKARGAGSRDAMADAPQPMQVCFSMLCWQSRRGAACVTQFSGRVQHMLSCICMHAETCLASANTSQCSQLQHCCRQLQHDGAAPNELQKYATLCTPLAPQPELALHCTNACLTEARCQIAVQQCSQQCCQPCPA